jgi:hypothetical protein
MKKGDIVSPKDKPHVKAKVNWVVDGSAGISYYEPEDYKGGCNQVNVADYDVIVESQETYQSSVEQMSVEELRANIERLRGLRMNSAKPTKVSTRVVVKADPTVSLLNGLSPEKIAMLKAKLGIQ